MWIISLLVGCGGPADCGVKECADICAQGEAPAPDATKPDPTPAPSGSANMTSFEASLLGPVLEDVRAGVRPFGAEGIGVCKGRGKTCDEYLGTTVDAPLPEGEYMLRAELAVPDSGERGTWKVKFDLECTTTRKTEKGENSATSNQSREYDVIYAGKDRGYRLQPLWTINSPNRYGASDCKYKITAPHPDGDKVYEGSWKVPAKE